VLQVLLRKRWRLFQVHAAVIDRRRAGCWPRYCAKKTVPPVAAVLNQHCNAVTSWAIDSSGEIKHAYA